MTAILSFVYPCSHTLRSSVGLRSCILPAAYIRGSPNRGQVSTTAPITSRRLTVKGSPARLARILALAKASIAQSRVGSTSFKCFRQTFARLLWLSRHSGSAYFVLKCAARHSLHREPCPSRLEASLLNADSGNSLPQPLHTLTSPTISG